MTMRTDSGLNARIRRCRDQLRPCPLQHDRAERDRRQREAPQTAEPFSLDDSLIVLDGRMFFVAGYTSGGAPYGVFVDEPTTEDRQADHGSWCGSPF